MATYNQISYGSKGSDVTELQKLLNQNGYTLDVDGDFGTKTQAAVKDYQQKNNLSVDGIVGTNTWGALTKASTGATTTQPATTTQTTATNNSGFQYGDYQESDVVKQAQALLQQQMANKPGDYTSSWQSQLNDILQQINNRKEFSYDLNADALYQQYKDQYMLQGQKAMMDTMGQAAAMTGGYGNSYAQSVGQQAYQGYLQQLNDRVPELYQLALDQYNREEDALYDQASIMASMEEQDYGRYRDQLSDYNTELNRLTEDARYQGEMDYSKWADSRDFTYGQYADDRNYAYQTERDKVADAQWQAQFDEAKRQYDQQYALSASKSSGGGDNPGSSYTANPGWDKATIEAFQREHKLTVDGIWGPQTAAAYDNDPNWKGAGGLVNFTGTTYSEAIAYAQSHGVDSSYTNAILSKADFSRKKASSSPSEAKDFDTYQEYLQYAVETMIDAYGK